jgi:hypothetical protein
MILGCCCMQKGPCRIAFPPGRPRAFHLDHDQSVLRNRGKSVSYWASCDARGLSFLVSHATAISTCYERHFPCYVCGALTALYLYNRVPHTLSSCGHHRGQALLLSSLKTLPSPFSTLCHQDDGSRTHTEEERYPQSTMGLSRQEQDTSH